MNEDPLLEGLNKEQVLAVTTLDGPLLIVAGAGSGKTKVITHRIAYLLKDKEGIGPHNILALTFSKKAAEEMRNRVGEMIDENPEDITIATFHSFCHSILQEHAMDMGLKKNFRLLDNVEQRIFFKNLIPNLKLDYYADMSDPAGFADAVLRFISRCKDELVDEEEYESFTKNMSDKEESRKSAEILAAYRLYQKKSREAGCVDFGDLIIRTIELFKKRKKILAGYQERYKYILVDEFQDTNVAQIELIAMLARHHGNICVVGDDDQAIYRFRGASYASFVKFKEYFPVLKHFKLTQNYRSTKKILRVAEELIKNNDVDRYDPKKSLWTQHGEGEDVEVIIGANYLEEARYIVEKIKDIYKKEGNFNKIAVLYRAHLHKEELLKLLKIENIPHSVSGGIGIFESDEVKEIFAYLKALTDPEDSASLFKLASSVDYDIDYADLVRISTFAKYHNLPLYNGLRKVKEIDISDDTRKKVKIFFDNLKDLKRTSDKYNLIEFLYQLIALKTSILSRAFIRQSAHGEPSLRNIGKFYNLISQYVSTSKNNSLHSLMEYVDAYREVGGKLESEEDIRSDYGVRLMTVHQAKGLEFPYVFIINLVQKRFPTSFKKELIPFPEELIKEQMPKGSFHIEEERRLLYVALTRAQNKLFLSGIRKTYSRPSIFLDEINVVYNGKSPVTVFEPAGPDSQQEIKSETEIPLSDLDIIKIKSAKRIAKLIGDIKPDKLNDKTLLSKIEKSLKTEFKDLLNNLRFLKGRKDKITGLTAANMVSQGENVYSFTQVETYMNCPLKYKFSFVDNIPRRPKPYFTLGSIIHNVLKEFYISIQKDEEADLKKLLRLYNDFWIPSGFKNKKEERMYKARGEKELREFFNKNKDTLKPPLYIEKKFMIELGGKPFKGFIDRIDGIEGGGVEIIDYKTGKFKKETGMQLDLYAVAAMEQLGLEVNSLSFYYMSGNEKKQFKRTADDLDRTKVKVTDVMNKIESGGFHPNISYKCKFCDYQILCPAYNK